MDLVGERRAGVAGEARAQQEVAAQGVEQHLELFFLLRQELALAGQFEILLEIGGGHPHLPEVRPFLQASQILWTHGLGHDGMIGGVMKGPEHAGYVP